MTHRTLVNKIKREILLTPKEETQRRFWHSLCEENRWRGKDADKAWRLVVKYWDEYYE